MLFDIYFIGFSPGIIVEAENMDIVTARYIMRKHYPIRSFIFPVGFRRVC